MPISIKKLRMIQLHVLQDWSALHAYFYKEAEDDTTARVARLDQHFKSPMTKLVMLFLEYALESL